MAVIQKDDKGPLVLSLQKALISKGYLSGPADGNFGSKTLLAVQKFQKSKGLTPDGIAGPATLLGLLPSIDPLNTKEDLSNFALGIDVSHYQGKMNWAKVASNGISFSYLKATESDHILDSFFNQNWPSLGNSSVIRGAYHFYRTNKDATAQAQSFCRNVGKLAKQDLPPMLDFETMDDKGTLSTSVRLKGVLTWLSIVESQLGKKPILYSYKGFLDKVLGGSTAFAGYPLWIASYPLDKPKVTVKFSDLAKINPPSKLPAGWNDWTIWQFTGQGVLTKGLGQGSAYDLDIFHGTQADLKRFAVNGA